MRTFGVEIWDDEGRMTTFYTVRKGQSTESETDKFFLRFETDATYRAQVQTLIAFILDSIGDEFGAREEFFRFENAASALPPPPAVVRRLAIDFEGFPLRLYCLRITKGLVVLMGGGIKNSQRVQDSPDLVRAFSDANAFSKAIDKALKERALRVHPNGRSLVWEDEDYELNY